MTPILIPGLADPYARRVTLLSLRKIAVIVVVAAVMIGFYYLICDLATGWIIG